MPTEIPMEPQAPNILFQNPLEANPVPAVPAAPAPIQYTPTADELSAATPVAPVAPVKYTPTPQELSSATPVPGPNLFEALTPDQLVAEAKANPKEVDPIAAFQSLPADRRLELMDKAAETFHKLRESGHYVPSMLDMVKNAGKSVVDLAKTGATLANIGIASLFTNPTETPDPATFRGALELQTKQQAGEFLAGQKMAGLGLGNMIAKGADWVGRGLHLTKQLKDYTPEDKINALGAELATRHGMAEITKDSVSPERAAELAKMGFALRPEKAEEAASGSPFAWEAAGKVFGAVTGTAGIATRTALRALPVPVQAAIARLPAAASDITSAAVGRTIQGASRAGEKIAEKAERISPGLGKVIGAAGGVFAGHHLAGLPGVALGIAEGFKRGGEFGESAATGLGKAAVGLDKLAEMGKQVATGKDVTSGAAQLVRDVTQAAPGVAAQVGAGAALDVGAQTATTETPGEQAGFTPFGTILGSAGALKGAGKRIVSGQILAPRFWGSSGAPERPATFTSNFPSLDTVHNESFSAAPQGVQQRLNAIQKYVDGAAPGTQVVYAPRPEAGHADPLPQALADAGMNPAIADQDGAFDVVKGEDGNNHRIAIVRDVEAAPHESRHAIDDVIGASGVRDLNAEAKRVYADKWDAFKQQYADRLTQTGLPTSDPNGTILRETGAGDAQAKEKIIAQARQSLGPNATEAQVTAEAGKAITDLQQQAQDAGKPLWEHVLTPAEQQDAVDQYVGNEVRAEHHDAWFKAGRPGEARGKMWMKAAQVLQAMGINPVEGRSSDYGAPMEGELVGQAQKSSPKVAIEPTEPAKEGTPQARAEGVRNAQKAAQEASNQPFSGSNKSPKEVLGVVAEAIARDQGVKLSGLFAPEEPAASLTSNRDVRRQMIEIYRTMPDAAKKLWGKLFFPQNVPVTARGGNLQIFGWAPEVFAANAHKTAGALNILADKGVNLSPYELDPVTKSFTDQGWRDLYEDVQKYVQNQKSGRTGAGNSLVVPELVTKAGAAAPAVRGEATPLAQDKADFINSLFNAKLPDTGLARQGALNMPLNKAGQLVSAATLPGRVETPARPRGTFRGAVAARQGVKGEPIMEVNPFRNRFESALQQAGVEIPSLLEVNQRLNLRSIKDIELAPEQGKFGANTLTLQAGFQPPKTTADFLAYLDTSSPEDFTKESHAYSGKYFGGMTGLSYDIGAQVKTEGELASLRSSAEKFRSLSQTAMKDKNYQDGIVFASKSQAAREAYEAAADEGGSGDFIRRVDPAYKGPMSKGGATDELTQFQPSKEPRAIRAAAVKDIDTGKIFEAPAHFYVHSKMLDEGYDPQTLYKHPQGFVTNGGEFLDRKQALARAEEMNQLVKAKSELPQDNFGLASEETKFQPRKGNEDIQKIAKDYAGPNYVGHSGYDALTEEQSKKIADEFHAAAHEPESPAVQKAYGALKDETVSQWEALEAAGYKMEPWTKPGQPYATSAEMSADVRNNKHIWYFPTAAGYGEGGVVASHPMLENSGLTAAGKPVPYNDAFRAVHDIFGHAKEGYEFGPRGEYNAYLAHSAMFSDEAKPALAAETLGQNSWVNFGPHLRDANGNIPKKGEAGFVAPQDRPFAEQKATMFKPDASQFQPARNTPTADKEWELKPGTGGTFTKAWILPDGKLKQFGSEWHHNWLNQQGDLREKYGIPVGDDETVRTAALKKGFLRVNYDKNSGLMTVEARQKDWPGHVEAVKKLVQNNLGKVDQVQVNLLSPSVKLLEDSGRGVLFDKPRNERLGQIPFTRGSTGTVDVAQEGMAGEEGSQNLFNKAAGTRFQPAKPQTHPTLDEFKDPEQISAALTKPGWAILTATQSKLGDNNSAANKSANAVLEQRLKSLGYEFTPVRGSYKGEDQGLNFLVQAISPDVAKDLGNEFNQESVITNHGLVYGDGSVTPVDPSKNVVGEAAKKQDGWSQVGDGPAFSMGLDFSKKIEPKESPVIVVHPEDSSLTDFTKPIKYAKKEVAEMSKTELQQAYPEVETAGHGDKIDKQISPGITDSPLYKQAGSEEGAVKLFKTRMVDFAKRWQKNPIFQDGAKWYSEIVPLIKQHYGEYAGMFAELLAATSPQNDPANNFALANDALNLFKRGEFDKHIKKYEEGLAKIDDDTWKTWFAKEIADGHVKGGNPEKKPTEAAYMAHWLDKHDIIPRKSNGKLFGMHSIPVLQVLARRWLKNTTGLKTQNFIQNLIGAAHDATVDIWAGRTMRRLGYSGHTDRWRLLPFNTAGVNDKDFLFSQKVFKAAADEMGMSPDALQGALWFAEKHLWADNGWSRLDLGDYRKEIPKRDELDRDIELNLASRNGGELPPMTLTKRATK